MLGEGHNNKNATLIRPLVLFLLLSTVGMLNPLTVSIAFAGFSTNFNTAGIGGSFYSSWNGSCPYSDANCNDNYLGNGDPSPIYERAEQINGAWYFHSIVGDPATGFAQEAYTRIAGNGSGGNPGNSEMADGFSPYGAGMDEAVAAPNATGGLSGSYGSVNSFLPGIGNVGNPLDSVHISGNGGYDPSRSVFHMVLVSADGDMALDVNKPFLDGKPIISQTVQDGGMTSTFVTDMTNISYSEMNKAAPMVNTLVFNDPTIPGDGAANFDIANAQQAEVTAGRFTFTRPSNYGWNNSRGWDAAGSYFTLGTYTYYGATTGFDVYNTDWTRFFEYDQNALSCLRPGAAFRRLDEGKASVAGGPTGVGSCPGH